MKFREKELTPGLYQYYFLYHLGELVPDVLETLKNLVPKYEDVFGAFDYDRRMVLYQILISNNTAKGNFVLFNLDPSIQHYDPATPEPSEVENPILKNFLEFRQSFCDFITRFYLDKYWLKQDLFAFLYQLSKYPKHYEVSDDPKNQGRLALAAGSGYMVYTGEPLNFTFDGWEIGKDSKDFEQQAMAAFENHLREYLERTAKQAKSNGYKLAQGRGNDFDRLQWLVVWNRSQAAELWEILPDIEEFEMIDLIKSQSKKEAERGKAADRLRKAFQEFEKFDLPVRPLGLPE